MTWCGHIIERWCLCQDTCLQETKHGCITNQAWHLPKRVEGATRSNRCVVCSEKYKQSKRLNPVAKDKDLPKRAKTVYWCKSCKVFLCIASDNKNCFEL